MKIKTKEQYQKFLDERVPKNREALPLGRKHVSRTGKKKERKQK